MRRLAGIIHWSKGVQGGVGREDRGPSVLIGGVGGFGGLRGR